MPRYYSMHDFLKIGVKGFVPEPSATAPVDPANGQLWTDSTGSPSVLKRWDGAGWETLGELLDGAVTTAKLADGAVTDAKLAGSIPLSKLATDPLARAGHTGTQPASTISDLDAVVVAHSLSEFAALTGDLDLAGAKLTNVGAPTDPGDAAPMSYVDASRAGFRGVKDPVRVATDPGFDVANPPAAIDGVTMANGDRFLVPDDGIYVFNGAGTAATRADDAADGQVGDGTTVAVAEGTDAGYIYIQRNDVSGGGAQDWGVFSAGGLTYTAGTGLDLTGGAFSLPVVPVTLGGTGATTAAGARTGLGAASAYGTTVPAASLPGGGTAAVVTHNLDTAHVSVSCVLDSNYEHIQLDWRLLDTQSIELSSDIALDADVLVTVIGA